MDKQSIGPLNDLRDFIAIDESEGKIRFFFTEAALDILKHKYELQNDEISEGIISTIISDDAVSLISNPDSMVNLIEQMESRALCEKFISNIFPRFKIIKHIIKAEEKETSIETTCLHCNRTPCLACLKAVKP